jgi:hypothetical protein
MDLRLCESTPQSVYDIGVIVSVNQFAVRLELVGNESVIGGFNRVPTVPSLVWVSEFPSYAV